jgi:hypothetical protein
MRKSLFIGVVLVVASMGFGIAQGTSPFIEKGAVNGIRYMAGGVGSNERAAMEERAEEYSLKLVFALNTGEYLSRIHVVIREPEGEVLLNALSNGPLFFADLPRGRYGIAVTYKDQRKLREVEVGEALRTIFFHWKP